ncbi:MAG: acyl-CoA dehydrogenase family protein, partial [Geminicoccales bacterium]
MRQVVIMPTSSAAIAEQASGLPTHRAADAAQALLDQATERVRALVAPGGHLDAERLEREQHAAHGLAWLATYVQALRQMHGWAARLDQAGRLGEVERLILEIAFGEYLARIEGGIPMSQGEIVRLAALGLDGDATLAFRTQVGGLVLGNSVANRARLASLIERDQLGDWGDWGLEDDTLELIREQFRRFAEEQLLPHAQTWHLRDELIPIEVVEATAGLGVFGLTVPEAFGGLGMGKVALCVVTEELSRGYIGVGSLGTRSEIAAELIQLGGTDAQKTHYLPKIASGQ